MRSKNRLLLTGLLVSNFWNRSYLWGDILSLKAEDGHYAAQNCSLAGFVDGGRPRLWNDTAHPFLGRVRRFVPLPYVENTCLQP